LGQHASYKFNLGKVQIYWVFIKGDNSFKVWKFTLLHIDVFFNANILINYS
jgi:uncharacterized protein (DUF779 family)